MDRPRCSGRRQDGDLGLIVPGNWPGWVAIVKLRTIQMRINMARAVTYFLRSVGILLFITAAAKLASSFGAAPILNLRDPIFGLSFRTIFIIAGSVELILALWCFFGGHVLLKTMSVAALSCSIVAYRLSLGWIGYHRPCHCLGDFTDMLRIPEETADTIMKFVLGYFLAGSFAILSGIWHQKRKALKTLGEPAPVASLAGMAKTDVNYSWNFCRGLFKTRNAPAAGVRPNGAPT